MPLTNRHGAMTICKCFNFSNLGFATSMVHQFMPEFSSQKNAIILCDSGYIKQNFVSILSSKVSVEQAQS
ncbi:hypothetical protein [Agathobacter rectalis]|uniref:hypothetical protein n=1 Tax=Agathobacter rectalis TaxID=39491 RepID=UPI0012D84EEC|nr:hypothetical protein [Agathobacter rectalis]